MEDKTSALVIGDLHFRNKTLKEGQELAEKIINIADEKRPSFIVILGDTLHYHGNVQILAHNLSEFLIRKLRKICVVFLIIGNHDLISHNEYLSSRHIFGPFKEWESVVVVDKPIFVTINCLDFVFCPYVPVGRFEEALNVLIEEGVNWQLADCIFAHQEIRGCSYNSRGCSYKPRVSTTGDLWSTDYPPIISGHIHHSQTIGNVFYPGSAGQHDFGDESEKHVWFVEFDEGTFEPPFFSTEKINVCADQRRKTISTTIDELKDFDESILEDHKLRLILHGTSEDYTVFRRGKIYKKLIDLGVQIDYGVEKKESIVDEEILGVGYRQVLEEVVNQKEMHVREAFKKLDL